MRAIRHAIQRKLKAIQGGRWRRDQSRSPLYSGRNPMKAITPNHANCFPALRLRGLAGLRRLGGFVYRLVSVRDFQMAVTLGSRAEQFQMGKALRRKTPREAHADLKGSMS